MKRLTINCLAVVVITAMGGQAHAGTMLSRFCNTAATCTSLDNNPTIPRAAGDGGFDYGSFTVTVVPEPSETTFLIAVTTLALWTRCRARRA